MKNLASSSGSSDSLRTPPAGVSATGRNSPLWGLSHSEIKEQIARGLLQSSTEPGTPPPLPNSDDCLSLLSDLLQPNSNGRNSPLWGLSESEIDEQISQLPSLKRTSSFDSVLSWSDHTIPPQGTPPPQSNSNDGSPYPPDHHLTVPLNVNDASDPTSEKDDRYFAYHYWSLLNGGAVDATVNNSNNTTIFYFDQIDPNTDVIYGRGTGSNENMGNKRYRKLIEEWKLHYWMYNPKLPEHRRMMIIGMNEDKCILEIPDFPIKESNTKKKRAIIQHIQNQVQGRFVALETESQRWYEVDASAIKEKIAQALRDENTRASRAAKRQRMSPPQEGKEASSSNPKSKRNRQKQPPPRKQG